MAENPFALVTSLATVITQICHCVQTILTDKRSLCGRDFVIELEIANSIYECAFLVQKKLHNL